MTIWIQPINGKPHIAMQFPGNEMQLLKKYHQAITRLTKMDFSNVLNKQTA